MKLVTALLVVMLTLVNLTSAQGNGTRVLCIESDGSITVEDSSTGCCGSGEFFGSGSTEAETVGGVALSACDSCIDIPLLAMDHLTKAPTDTAHRFVAALIPVLVLDQVHESSASLVVAPVPLTQSCSTVGRTTILRC
jgi:hypothetical protein